MVDNPFEKFDLDALKKYESKKAEKGETWKTMPLKDLRDLLVEEAQEWIETAGFNEERNELKDIVNLARMIGTRLEGDEEE